MTNVCINFVLLMFRLTENTMNHSKSQQFYPPQQQNYHQQQPQYNYPPHQPNQYNPVQEQNSFRNNSSGQFNDPMKASLMAEIRNQTKVNTSHTELIKKGIQKPATPPSYQTASNQTYNFGPSQAQPLRSSAQPRTSGSLSMRMLNKDLQTVEGTRRKSIFLALLMLKLNSSDCEEINDINGMIYH